MEIAGAEVLQYGSEPVTYETLFGLMLNKHRMFTRRALCMASGLGMAFGGNRAEIAEAMAETPAQAEVIRQKLPRETLDSLPRHGEIRRRAQSLS